MQAERNLTQMVKTSLFESLGYQVIDDFLGPDECKDLLDLIAGYREQHELPEIYRPAKPRSLRYYVIDGEQIKQHLSKIRTLYQGVVNEQVNQLTSTQFAPLANTRAGVNVNIMPPSRSEYRWHYDRVSVTGILYLNAVEGGETVLYPNYRILLKNRNRMRVQRMLDRLLRVGIIRDTLRDKIVVNPRPGRLAIQRGNRSWHSVRPVRGSHERINLILAYDVPGAQFPMEKSLDSYLYTQEKQTSADPNYG
jgi:hypothetical protein